MAGAIGHGAKHRKELGQGLNFVEHNQSRQVPQGQFGVLQSTSVRHGFQVEKRCVLPLSEGASEGGFAALSRAEERRDRRALDRYVQAI
jgi:hypothetical protein